MVMVAWSRFRKLYGDYECRSGRSHHPDCRGYDLNPSDRIHCCLEINHVLCKLWEMKFKLAS